MHKIERWLRPMLGEICWDVRYPNWPFSLDMNLGKPGMEVRQPKRKLTVKEAMQWVKGGKYDPHLDARRWARLVGQWWLSIDIAYVRFAYEGVTLASTSSTDRRKTIAGRYLAGQKVKLVEIDAATGFTRFCFDLGVVVDVRRRAAGSHEELWTLRLPDGYFLSIHGDGTYAHDVGSRFHKDMKRYAIGDAGQTIVVK
jgi:hypothetical protein